MKNAGQFEEDSRVIINKIVEGLYDNNVKRGLLFVKGCYYTEEELNSIKYNLSFTDNVLSYLLRLFCTDSELRFKLKYTPRKVEVEFRYDEFRFNVVRSETSLMSCMNNPFVPSIIIYDSNRMIQVSDRTVANPIARSKTGVKPLQTLGKYLELVKETKDTSSLEQNLVPYLLDAIRTSCEESDENAIVDISITIMFDPNDLTRHLVEISALEKIKFELNVTYKNGKKSSLRILSLKEFQDSMDDKVDYVTETAYLIKSNGHITLCREYSSPTRDLKAVGINRYKLVVGEGYRTLVLVCDDNLTGSLEKVIVFGGIY